MKDPQTDMDAEISALLDGELDAEARARLERALAADPLLAQRAALLGGVDAGIRSLAARPIPEARLAEQYARLSARLAPPASPRRSRATRFGPLYVVAAAAVLALAVLVPRLAAPPDGVDGSRPAETLADRSTPSARIASSSDQESHAEEDVESGEDRMLALGYGEDPASFLLAPGVSIEDLEIIEDLDLLEYLATQGEESRG